MMNSNLRLTLRNVKKEDHLEDLREAICEVQSVKDRVEMLYSHGHIVNERFRAVVVAQVRKFKKKDQRTYPPLYLKNIYDMIVP